MEDYNEFFSHAREPTFNILITKKRKKWKGRLMIRISTLLFLYHRKSIKVTGMGTNTKKEKYEKVSMNFFSTQENLYGKNELSLFLYIYILKSL